MKISNFIRNGDKFYFKIILSYNFPTTHKKSNKNINKKKTKRERENKQKKKIFPTYVQRLFKAKKWSILNRVLKMKTQKQVFKGLYFGKL